MTKPAPLTTPDKGYEICYECDGKRLLVLRRSHD
jgi:hypothetical protein